MPATEWPTEDVAAVTAEARTEAAAACATDGVVEVAADDDVNELPGINSGRSAVAMQKTQDKPTRHGTQINRQCGNTARKGANEKKKITHDNTLPSFHRVYPC